MFSCAQCVERLAAPAPAPIAIFVASSPLVAVAMCDTAAVCTSYRSSPRCSDVKRNHALGLVEQFLRNGVVDGENLLDDKAGVFKTIEFLVRGVEAD
jgi:hypothetical protein